MTGAIDAYAAGDSPIHRWEPRCKLIGLGALILAFAFVDDLVLVPAMLAVTLSVYAVASLPVAFVLTRLRYPGIFFLAVALILPFAAGSTVVASIGPLAVRQEGLLLLVRIAARLGSILTLGLVLFGTAPLATTIQAMRALGLPAILADMTLLAYRYLHELGTDLRRMQTAMAVRGFKHRRRHQRLMGTWASLLGSLLVRSYERAERVYRAMRLRGYGAETGLGSVHAPPGRADLIGLLGSLLGAIGLTIGALAL